MYKPHVPYVTQNPHYLGYTSIDFNTNAHTKLIFWKQWFSFVENKSFNSHAHLMQLSTVWFAGEPLNPNFWSMNGKLRNKPHPQIHITMTFKTFFFCLKKNRNLALFSAQTLFRKPSDESLSGGLCYVIRFSWRLRLSAEVLFLNTVAHFFETVNLWSPLDLCCFATIWI